MKLIEDAHRKTRLIKAGVPSVFFNLLDSADEYPELDIKNPEGAYFNLPIMKNYEILSGFTVVPICDIGEGDSFLLYLANETEQKFIYCAIEADEVFEDYGLNISSMFANLLIDSYDAVIDELLEDGATDEEIEETLEHLTSIGVKMGLEETASKKIIDRLYKADIDEEDRFEGEDEWIKKHIHSIFS